MIVASSALGTIVVVHSSISNVLHTMHCMVQCRTPVIYLRHVPGIVGLQYR